jgi:hypothetical protein
MRKKTQNATNDKCNKCCVDNEYGKKGASQLFEQTGGLIQVSGDWRHGFACFPTRVS